MAIGLDSVDIERMLVRKLRCHVDEKRKDICYEVGQDDVLVARTWLSHAWRSETAIGPNMLSHIKRQLYLPSLDAQVQLVDCRLELQDYLDLVLGT